MKRYFVAIVIAFVLASTLGLPRAQASYSTPHIDYGGNNHE